MAEHPQEEEGLPGLLSDDSYFFSSDEHEEFDSELVDPADEPDGSAPGPEPGAQNRVCPPERARFERAQLQMDLWRGGLSPPRTQT